METEDNTILSKYEIMLLIRPNLGDKELQKVVDEVKNTITSSGGEVYHEDDWGIRDLAYRIKKEDQGHYMVMNFTLDPEKLSKLSKPLNIEQNVLRFLVSKTSKKHEIKTFEEYEKAHEIEKAEAERVKAEKAKKKETKTPTPTPKKAAPKKEEPKKEEPKVEKKPKVEEKPVEEPAEEAKEEPKEEPKIEEKVEEKEEPKVEEKPEEEKSSKSSLDEMDAKLKSIIDDPDIRL